MAGGFRARVRGIYATALTRLLLDNGFEIVQPSVEVVERFGSAFSEGEPDLVIRDRRDRQGIEASGGVEAVGALGSVLRGELVDAIFRRPVDGRFLDVEFPWDSKRRLDELRGRVVPTVPGHHYYKACGGGVSAAVEMAERLLLRGRPADEVEALLRRTVEPHLPYEGHGVFIEHVKLSGEVLSLGRAVIEAYDEGGRLRYARELRGRGVYDGLGVAKEAGDRAVTEVRPGGYHTVTRYFSRGGRFKGAYVNLNTPVELYPSKVRYVDLEVDICVWPGGEVRVLDEELLERAAAEGVVSDGLVEVVRRETEALLARFGVGADGPRGGRVL